MKQKSRGPFWTPNGKTCSCSLFYVGVYWVSLGFGLSGLNISTWSVGRLDGLFFTLSSCSSVYWLRQYLVASRMLKYIITASCSRVSLNVLAVSHHAANLTCIKCSPVFEREVSIKRKWIVKQKLISLHVFFSLQLSTSFVLETFIHSKEKVTHAHLVVGQF